MQGSERVALDEVNRRIDVIERRLRNAKSARDSYIDYLRSKYPRWRPALATYASQEPSVEKYDLYGEMRTLDYFWDARRDAVASRQRQRPPPPRPAHLHNQIPRSGLLLDSELPRMRRRLGEIEQSLLIMRDVRFLAPTIEAIDTAPSLTIGFTHEAADEGDTIGEVRRRLNEMTFSSPPILEISPEEIAKMKRQEERDRLMKDIREGRIPSVLDAPAPGSRSVAEDDRREQLPPPPSAIQGEEASQPATHSSDDAPVSLASPPPSRPRVQFADERGAQSAASVQAQPPAPASQPPPEAKPSPSQVLSALLQRPTAPPAPPAANPSGAGAGSTSSYQALLTMLTQKKETSPQSSPAQHDADSSSSDDDFGKNNTTAAAVHQSTTATAAAAAPPAAASTAGAQFVPTSPGFTSPPASGGAGARDPFSRFFGGSTATPAATRGGASLSSANKEDDSDSDFFG